MIEGIPHIEVRAVQVDDAQALYELGSDFETDRIYTLRVQNHLLSSHDAGSASGGQVMFAFELIETQVDPPLYKRFHTHDGALARITSLVHKAGGGFVALTDGKIAGGIFLTVDRSRSVARIQEWIVGRQYRRYGIGSLLLCCASDWGREQKCWALVFETQNTNYPAVQFCLRNGFEIWSISQHFYPPGVSSHEVALFLGKRLSSVPEV